MGVFACRNFKCDNLTYRDTELCDKCERAQCMILEQVTTDIYKFLGFGPDTGEEIFIALRKRYIDKVVSTVWDHEREHKGPEGCDD